MNSNTSDLRLVDLGAIALDAARAAGATFADALLLSGRSTSVKVRLGETIEVIQSHERGLGVRVLVHTADGTQTATTSTSDLSPDAIRRVVTQAVALARQTARDPFAGPPDPTLAAPFPDAPSDLDTLDPAVEALTADRALDLAREAEAAALEADPRLSLSEGAECGWGATTTVFFNSTGQVLQRRSSGISLSVSPVAVDPTHGKQSDYWFSSARHRADLASPSAIGARAAERTLRRVGARKIPTTNAPVIFEAPMASRLLGSIAGAAQGGAIFRGASWLVDKLGQVIASPLVTLVDDPWIVRGGGSRLFDGEGLATRPLTLVTQGTLNHYLLDTYSAKKLGMASTRSAGRGLGGSPTPTTSNLWMSPGRESLAQLIAATPRGLLVTDSVGGGANIVTGDFSQGVVGLWIEDGAIAYPVEEITIASTLGELWAHIDAIADDRDPSRATSAPSFRVAQMTIAGS